MNTNLEHLIRRTLATRAEQVNAGPDWAGMPTANAQTSRSLRRVPAWVAVVATAAAVLAVAVGIVALRSPSRHAPGTPPTMSKPTLTLTPAPARVVATACAASLPAPWTAALQNSRLDSSGRTATPLSVAPDGSVIAVRDDGVTPGSGREVIAVQPGRPVRILYPISNPDQLTAAAAYVVGTQLVVGLTADARPARGVIPGSTPIGLRGIILVDLTTGASRVLAGQDSPATGSGSSPYLQSLVVLNGVAYWDSENSYGAATGTLDSYDLSAGNTGAVHRVYSGPIGWPVADAAGIGWTDNSPTGFRFAVTATLPPPVEHAMTPFARPRLATDGTAYAWLDSPTLIGWWAPGHATPTYLRLPQSVATDNGYGDILVSGNIVLTSSPATQVVDIATHAVAPLPSTGVFSPQTRGDLLYANGPVVAGLSFGTQPGMFIDGYWADTPIQPIRIDLAGLPSLRC